MRRLPLVLALGLSAVAVAADPDPAVGPADVVATVLGERITLAQVDEAAAGGLQAARVEQYRVRREALDALVAERLLDDEAARRGLGREALIAAEVDAKVAPPSQAEIDAVYEANKAGLAGVAKDDVTPRIVAFLQEQARAEALDALITSLRVARGVRILLEPPRVDVPTEGEPSRGAADAPVTIVEFADYECPYCGQAEATVDELLRRFDGKVRLVFRDFPLSFHDHARLAARAAACAGDQGKFWPMHDALFAGPRSLEHDDLLALGKKLKLKRKTYEACLASDAHDADVARDLADGEALGVSGTPAFFVNGVLLEGAQPLEVFVEAVEDELQR